jgi:hypothetical protein
MDVELSQQWELERMQMKSKLAWILFLFMPLFPAVYILSKCIPNLIPVRASTLTHILAVIILPISTLILSSFLFSSILLILSSSVFFFLVLSLNPLLNHYLFISQ